MSASHGEELLPRHACLVHLTSEPHTNQSSCGRPTAQREEEHGRSDDRPAERARKRGGHHPGRRRLRRGPQGLQRHDRPAAGVVVRCASTPTTSSPRSTSRGRTGSTWRSAGAAHSVPGFGTARRRGGRRPVRHAGGRRSIPRRGPRARQGGATWGSFNDATHAYGLATTGGIISTTGVGGLTLGGGIGYLARGLGLSCDNLLSAEVVTADGQFADRERERERGPVLGAARRRRQLRRRDRRSSSELHPVRRRSTAARCSSSSRTPPTCCGSTASSSPTRPRSSAASRPCRSRRRCRSSRRTGTASRSSRSWPAGPGRSTRARRR